MAETDHVKKLFVAATKQNEGKTTLSLGLLAAMSSCAVGIDKSNCVAGMLLTGGERPHENIMRLIRRTQIPVILVNDDSYTTAAAAVNNIKVKIQPLDKKKIVMARRLVKRFVSVQKIIDRL